MIRFDNVVGDVPPGGILSRTDPAPFQFLSPQQTRSVEADRPGPPSEQPSEENPDENR